MLVNVELMRAFVCKSGKFCENEPSFFIKLRRPANLYTSFWGIRSVVLKKILRERSPPCESSTLKFKLPVGIFFTVHSTSLVTPQSTGKPENEAAPAPVF